MRCSISQGEPAKQIFLVGVTHSKPRGKFLEAWDAVGDMMKRLCVLGEDRHVGLKECGIIHRAYLHHKQPRRAGRSGADSRAAARAEVSGHGIFNVRALERVQLALSELKSGLGDHDEYVGIATRNVLALSAVTLHRRPRLSVKAVADLAAITSTFNFHIVVSSVIRY